MAGLARGEENQPSKINWFILVSGVNTDAFEIGFRIFDIVGGLPGTQVFPVAGYEDVTNAPGKFGVGSYYAYDNGAGTGYTPELTASVGTHRIEWRWKISAGAAYQAGHEDFEVLVESAGGSTDTYCSILDIRNEGLTDPPYSDAQILSYIEIWQSFLDRACRQWFNPRTMIIEFDGTDSDAIHFGVPIITIEYLQINERGVDLEVEYYKVYSDRNMFQDRQNPRIKLVNNRDRRDIFTAPMGGRLIFKKGRKNQIVKGTFGYVEADSSTPKLIKRALTKLVIEKLTAPIYVPPGEVGGGSATPPILGNLLEEWTDGHRMKYTAPGGDTKPVAAGFRGITNDPEILMIIKLFKAPIGIATPANFSHK